MKRLLTGLLVCAAFGAVAASGTRIYHYTSDDGVPAVGNSVPAEAEKRGYYVTDSNGKVIERVARQLTPEEIAEKERQEAERKRREQEGEASARHDSELVKLYGSVRDVDDARDRKLLSIDTTIVTAKSNLERLRQQKERQESQAAERERDGLPPSPDLLDNLAILDNKIAETQREIDARQLEKERVKKQFDADRERIRLLYGGKAQPASDEKPASNPPQNPPKSPASVGPITTAKSDTLN